MFIRARLSEIRILYVRELRSALRERNIVINSILLPILLYPALLWIVYSGISFVAGQSEAIVSRTALVDLPPRHAALRGFLEGEDGVEVMFAASPRDALAAGIVDVVVEFREDGDRQSAENRNNAPFETAYRIDVLYDGSRERSRTAQSRVERFLSQYRGSYLFDSVRAAGFAPDELQQLWIDQRNVASGNEMGRFMLGLLAPTLMIVMLMVGAIYPAIDSTAGERENATWETLMTVSASRVSIVVAKYLYVATMSFTAGMLNVIALSVSLRSIVEPLTGAGASELDLSLPFQSLAVVMLGAALLALLLAAGIMLMASFARTFREGQSMVAPFYIALLLPLMLLQATDLRLTPQLAVIPVVNVTLVLRDAIVGLYDWRLIAITVAIELTTIALLLSLAKHLLSRESFVLGGHPERFGRFLRTQLFGWSRQR